MDEAACIWVITDGVPGHEARSRGIIEALAALRPVVPVWVPGRLRNRLSRAAMAIGMAGGRQAPGWLLRACHRFERPEMAPDLVIGAGGRTQFLTLSLAEAAGVPAVFAARTAWIDASRFSVVVVPYPVSGLTNIVELEVPVSAMTPRKASAAGAELRARLGDGPVWTLLAGGDGGGYRFSAGEWRGLGASLAGQAETAGATLCLSTSRRTGQPGEEALRSGLGGCVPEETIWWGEGDREPVLPLIGAADLVFVTADSASMAGEAVAAGKPVVALVPADTRPASRHRELLARLECKRRIVILPLEAISSSELPDPASFCLLEQPPTETIARALGPVLGWS